MFNHWTILLLISAFVALEIYQYQQHNDGTSLSAHYGGATAGLCLGMLFLRNPNLEFHEKYFLIPLAAIGTVMFVLGGTSWVFSTWPPSYVFHLESKTYAGRPCCWQVARCDGLSEDDYNLFKCKTSSVSRGDYDDLTKSTLWADGRLYDNCPDMLNYSNWKSGGSACKFNKKRLQLAYHGPFGASCAAVWAVYTHPLRLISYLLLGTTGTPFF